MSREMYKKIGEAKRGKPAPWVLSAGAKDIYRKISEKKKGKEMPWLNTEEVVRRRSITKKGKPNIKLSEYKKDRACPHLQNDKNAQWKGDTVGYGALHSWVSKWKGKPQECSNCGTTKRGRYHWANIDHKYRRVLDDYIRLCPSCHRNYDLKNNK